jgi:hypothetical protein
MKAKTSAGAAKRATSETLMNAASSRSHCVFTLTIATKEMAADGNDTVCLRRLSILSRF